MKSLGRHLAEWLFPLVVIAGIVVAVATTMRSTPTPAADTLERVRASGVVRVGYANEAPFAYLDPATGQVTGEAVEVARLAFAELGVPRVEGVLTEFGSLIPGLKADRYDVIAAGMYITPARAREIAFTRPTYRVGDAFVVKAGNPLALHAYHDVARHATARLGVVAGAVQNGWARQLGVPDARIAVFTDYPTALEGLRAGRIDAIACTALTARHLLATAGDDGLARADPFTDPVIDGRTAIGYGAFGVRQEDTALRNALDRALGGILGGVGHRLAVARFGFSAEELPDKASAEAVLAP